MKRQIGAAVDLENYSRVCCKGTTKELEHLLVNEHADPNEFRGEFKCDGSPLISVCLRGYDNDDAIKAENGASTFDMARLLLEHGASARTIDNMGDTALHCACLWSTLDVVKLLIEHGGAYVDALNEERKTPISYAMSDHTDPDEMFRIVSHLVVECKAHITENDLRVALRLPDSRCFEVMLKQPSGKENADAGVLLEKASGMANGADKLRVLLAEFPNEDITEPMIENAFRASRVNMELLIPRHGNPNPNSNFLKNTLLDNFYDGDAMARVELAVQSGYLTRPTMRMVFTDSGSPYTIWCTLQLTKGNDYEMRLSPKTPFSNWYWLGSRFHSQQFSANQNNTLLHLASIHNTAALRVLAKHDINPHLKDDAGKLAIDFVPAADKEARAFLLTYMQWRPTRIVTDWFGPYFSSRAKAFLCVCVRIDPRGETIQRDVRHKIIRYMAANECVSI